MRLAGTVLAFLCLIVLAYSLDDGRHWAKQKFVLEVLKSIHFPLPNEKPKTTSWVSDVSKYSNSSAALTFFDKPVLKRGAIFTIYSYEHMQHVYHLYNLFHHSVDWDTFHKNAMWARVHVNEGVFICAFTLAVWHRSDMQGVVLPPISEIYPYYFVNTDTIRQATQGWQMYDAKYYDDHGSKDALYSSFDSWNDDEERGEHQLAYFTEDVDLNSYYYYLMMGNPFFLSFDANLFKNHQAEFYYYLNQQLMARYYLERQSSSLGSIGNFDWLQPYQVGYGSHLSYWNGVPFLPRYDHCTLQPDTAEGVARVINYVKQVNQIIDLGFIAVGNGTVFNLHVPRAADYIGTSFYNNQYGLCPNFYHEALYRQLLSGGGKYHNTIPSALMHFETSLRDPVFYELYNHLVKVMWKFRSYLPQYKHDELVFDGVQIKDVTVDKLVTFFEHHDLDVSSAVPASEKQWDSAVYARRKRINHKPFTYTLNVQASKPTKGVIRMYMGPKYKDVKQLQHLRKQFFLMDQYVYDFDAGSNNVTRHSRDYHRTIGERTSYKKLYHQVLKATRKEDNDAMKHPCWWPNRLLIPKGRTGRTGFNITFYFIITPYLREPKGTPEPPVRPVNSCAIDASVDRIDDLPLGFPFDRNIDVTTFFTENSLFKPVSIYHEEL